ncbi:RNA polymerase sigma factor [Pedobacter duraquae]|uniref:RNA polymerase sigma-70 factor (ECF subfamily) n=1 Tax=Pedobacter duraquae TaxID=425511 RepID=A0A4R6IHM8_9SPHI|nr:RNA polymerase sigma-70 factor [Pedobacter duraquae]TDO20695.1 RNA polymerase sigma-70 factor (ECF subfamily) [Pedobacter duraquae]
MTDINNLSDDELLVLIKKDDGAAFTTIYNRYAGSLAAFAGAKLYHLEDARDLLHDLFIKLWEDRYNLNIDTNLKNYLFSAVRYKVIDKIRKNVIRQDYSPVTHNSEDYGAQHQLEAKELQLAIEQSLNQLAPRTKEIFLLSRHQHQSISEIAQMLGLSEQTVKNQISAALKHLRQQLNTALLSSIFIYWWFYY